MTTRVDFSGQAKVPPAGPLVVTLGRPNAGKEWDLRALTICDESSPQTQHSTTAFIVGGSSETSLNPVDIKDVALCIPNTATYSRGTIILQSNDVLQVWAYGLPAGLDVLVTGQVETEQDR
ncbi:MAG: hypothetical protein L3K06_01940 [Thermoplasmata archaeon]|nr:hypothetical protein [Thermoplasmata archaeon]